MSFKSLEEGSISFFFWRKIKVSQVKKKSRVTVNRRYFIHLLLANYGGFYSPNLHWRVDEHFVHSFWKSPSQISSFFAKEINLLG